MRFVDIIYVDDNELNRVVVQKNLSPYFSVEVLPSAKNLFELLKVYVPRVVILDWMMPEISGVEALKILRSEEQFQHLIIIMLTARASKDDMVRAFSMGANEYIVKPPHFPEMIARIQALIRQQRAEEHFRLRNQIQSYETLLSGITHEFNNIFSALRLALQMYKTKGPDYLDDKLDDMHAFLKRGVDLVKNLRELRGPEGREFSKLDLDTVTRSALRDFESNLKANEVEILLESDDERYFVFGNSNQLVHVLLNLLSNAKHALSGVENPFILIRFERQENNIHLIIQDNGCGMDPEMLQKLGNLFFTTKGSFGGKEFDSKQSGTGLGLTICRRILNTHQASMEFKSVPGEGTEVLLEFPPLPEGL